MLILKYLAMFIVLLGIAYLTAFHYKTLMRYPEPIISKLLRPVGIVVMLVSALIVGIALIKEVIKRLVS